jgi:hypothetical protein
MFSLMPGGGPLYLFEYLVFSRSERTLRINLPRQSEYMVDAVLALGCGIVFLFLQGLL